MQWTNPMKLLAALLGLTTAVVALSGIAQAGSPSFRCDNLHTSHRSVDAERTICQSNRLGSLDRNLAGAYEQVKGQLNWRASTKLRRTQLAWLKHRNACGDDRRCIARKYRKRIRQLVRYENCFDHTARAGCVWDKLERHSRRWEEKRQFGHLNGWSRRDWWQPRPISLWWRN